ncbi:MAG: glycosyltransferase, partial [Rhizobiales bacterium]|nr:glycosyltransferase [Hyphomicrobiales bacterium]
MATVKRKAFVVLGMHRSGTSALAGALVRLGGEGPATPLKANVGNPLGYWESLPAMRFNDRILRELGGSWQEWRKLDTSSLRGEAVDELVDLLTTEWTGDTLVVKDPRICLLAPLWFSALAQADIEPFVVLTLRVPQVVAASLSRRDGMEPSRAHLLWMRHMIEAERRTRNFRRFVLTYDSLVEDWRAVLPRMYESFGLHLAGDMLERAAPAIDPALRHFGGEALAPLPPSLTAVGSAFDILSDMAAGREDAAGLARLDALAEAFNEQCLLFGEAPRLADPGSDATRLRESAQRLKRMENQLSATEKERDQARSALARHSRIAATYVAKHHADAQRLAALRRQMKASASDPATPRDKNASARRKQAREATAPTKPDTVREAPRRESSRLARTLLGLVGGMAGGAKAPPPDAAADRSPVVERPPPAPTLEALLARSMGPRGGVELLAGFPTQARPDVSIIIPCFNEIDSTVRCLVSVLRHTTGSYEVVVVDDCSPQEDYALLATLEGLVYVRAAKNAGFVGSCNLGAKKARGKFLLFLNNDTEVTHGWLQPLIDSFDQYENVGIVGSKLVYPDGRLQEAGCVYWRDATGLNYGRGRQGYDSPEFSYVREVDKVSGACLMIESSLFREIGGFDTLFAPGYKEDADLCFAARRHGRRVLYQPFSLVIHHEGVTAGTDTSAGMKQYQVLNRPKFVAKWREELNSDHFESSKENVFLARERPHGRPIILFIDNQIPEFNTNAGALGVFNYAMFFARSGFKVVFMPDNRKRREPTTTLMQRAGIEVLYESFSAMDWIEQYGRHVSVVWASRPEISIKYIEFIKEHSKAKIIYCGRDLHFLRYARQFELTGDPAHERRSLEFEITERSLFELCDSIVTFSDVEANIIKSMCSVPRRVKIIPPYIYESAGTPAYADDRRDILFLGNFAHAPNADGVRWFVAECWPAIEAAAPDARFTIVGHKSEAVADLQSERISVLGQVDDLAPVFRQARLSVAPLRYGA